MGCSRALWRIDLSVFECTSFVRLQIAFVMDVVPYGLPCHGVLGLAKSLHIAILLGIGQMSVLANIDHYLNTRRSDFCAPPVLFWIVCLFQIVITFMDSMVLQSLQTTLNEKG